MADVESPPKQTTVNIQMTESFLKEVDKTWEDHGFSNRSEFIRAVLRDAIKHPTFNRADLKAMLADEVGVEKGRTHSSDDIKNKFDTSDLTFTAKE